MGKLATVLTKKEAETYRAQGLHKEALGLYEQLVDASPNIDPSLKSAIQDQVQDITREMHTFEEKRNIPLSSEEILRIKEGWGQEASQADLMVCAQALYHVGAYEDALIEYQKLLQAGCEGKKLAGATALCLAKLHAPQKLPQAAEALLAEVAFQPGQAVAFQVRLAESLAGQKDITHAQVYLTHILRNPDLSAQAKARYKQILAGLQSGRSAKPVEKPAQQPPVANSGRRMVSRLLKFITGARS